MAHKKGQGSVRNGRDSQAKHRGIKFYAGEFARTGCILIRQCGTKWHPGKNVKRAKDDTLFALCNGHVYFDRDGRRINLRPEGEVAAISA
jgi:large subunit ribosomal protein L27